MLKKRSKAVSSKQGVMSPSVSLASLTGNLTHRPTSSSLFPALNPFLSFSPNKQLSDPESAGKCPNFTLHFKLLSSSCNPFFSNRRAGACINTGPGIKHQPWDERDCKPVGLAIVSAFTSGDLDAKSLMAENKSIWSGPLIKVQIPSANQSSLLTPSSESPHCPVEFGIKNKESQLAMALLSPGRKSPLGPTVPRMDNSPRALCLSPSEIELSEDYTCVISHGPQQKKTHIFDNIIIESCDNGFGSLGKIRLPSDQLGDYTSDYFLTSCHACRNKIVKGNDVFIYRGEKAFCSQECRNREIICKGGRDHS